MTVLTVAAIGILLGLRHALDADHVAAVATIVTRERSIRRAAWIGALWGIGHSISVMLVGGALIAFRLVMPPRLGLGLELGVAAMLIFLGYRSLMHPHEHPAADPSRRPLVVGIIHGLAGSAAAALLVLTTIQNTVAALTYLLVFCLGTTCGMVLVTGAVAAPTVWAYGHHQQLQRGIRLVAGVLSLALGIMLAHEIIVTHGLLSSAPTWSPK